MNRFTFRLINDSVGFDTLIKFDRISLHVAQSSLMSMVNQRTNVERLVVNQSTKRVALGYNVIIGLVKLQS
jgi:hypothetical protein